MVGINRGGDYELQEINDFVDYLWWGLSMLGISDG